jgi:hypothetical protein
MAYVDGYILALEDLLRDVQYLHEEAAENAPTDIVQRHMYGYTAGVARIHKAVRRIAGHSLHQARATLKLLEEAHHGGGPDKAASEGSQRGDPELGDRAAT